MINTDRLVQTFMNMVQVDSESGNEKKFAEYMMQLARKLGAKTWSDKYGNVFIEISGEGEPIMFNTHMDTVSPGVGIKPSVKNGYVVSDGTTILGADSKAGIAALIEVITILKEQSIPHRHLLITLTCNEESGIPTAQHIKSKIKTCIVPDRGTPVGEIITEAPYAQVYEVVITGKSAYATTNFKKGRHAILAAVDMIKKLPIGDIDAKTTSNVGIIEGGIMTSMVPDRCRFKGSCYSFSKKSFDAYFVKLRKVIQEVDKKYKTSSKLSMLEYFGGFSIEKKDPLVKTVDLAMRKTGIKPVYKVYKAVTNANLLNQVSIKSVLISTGVENQHTVEERISVKALQQISEILLNAAC